MIPNNGNPAVFLASAAQQANRMAAIAERDGDDAKAEMLRAEADKLAGQAAAAELGA